MQGRAWRRDACRRDAPVQWGVGKKLPRKAGHLSCRRGKSCPKRFVCKKAECPLDPHAASQEALCPTCFKKHQQDPYTVVHRPNAHTSDQTLGGKCNPGVSDSPDPLLQPRCCSFSNSIQASGNLHRDGELSLKLRKAGIRRPVPVLTWRRLRTVASAGPLRGVHSSKLKPTHQV